MKGQVTKHNDYALVFQPYNIYLITYTNHNTLEDLEGGRVRSLYRNSVNPWRCVCV